MHVLDSVTSPDANFEIVARRTLNKVKKVKQSFYPAYVGNSSSLYSSRSYTTSSRTLCDRSHIARGNLSTPVRSADDRLMIRPRSDKAYIFSLSPPWPARGCPDRANETLSVLARTQYLFAHVPTPRLYSAKYPPPPWPFWNFLAWLRSFACPSLPRGWRHFCGLNKFMFAGTLVDPNARVGIALGFRNISISGSVGNRHAP